MKIKKRGLIDQRNITGNEGGVGLAEPPPYVVGGSSKRSVSEKVSAQFSLTAESQVAESCKQQSLQSAAPKADEQQRIESLRGRLERLFCGAAGVRDRNLAKLLVSQMSQTQVWFSDGSTAERLMQAASALREMNPQGATEALLAVQMFAVHNAAVFFLRKATLDGQTFDGADACVLRGTRLMRLFNEQLESMAKLKGKTGQQKVTVEHVHVHSGGQAVVGMVESRKREKQR